jgi:hypothetical protein
MILESFARRRVPRSERATDSFARRENCLAALFLGGDFLMDRWNYEHGKGEARKRSLSKKYSRCVGKIGAGAPPETPR